jgi:2-polyprenyl-3-methyl-5-hydroxy-6-metoxy-1,4-benzoquinol methylase
MAPGASLFRSRWRSFWAKQTTPLSRDDIPDHDRLHARELALMFPERPLRMVLEVGCGNGALFEPLGFDQAEYTGLDYSEKMIAAFAQRYPQLRLFVADAHEYRDNRQYDLIFCNSVVQYFDMQMFDQWLQNAAAMLARDGVIVIGQIPWKTLRLRYCSGELTGRQPSRWRMAKGAMKSLLGFDAFGRWYSVGEIAALGARHGLRSEIFGSLFYSYRFHARMSRHGVIGVPTRGL